MNPRVVDSSIWDTTSAGVGRIPTPANSVAINSGLRADQISRRTPNDLPCREHDPNLWFSEHPAPLEIAKTFCAVCPARPGCLAGAISRREPWGVWGGEIFERGQIVASKRARGRPRKRVMAA